MKNFLYTGEARNHISFPLGGIGSGCIGLSGSGRLIDWEIYNRPNKDSGNGFSHFAIRADDGEKILSTRILNGDSYENAPGGGDGQSRTTLTGFPHFRDCTFEGKYPFAKLVFSGEDFPGQVTMEAFNPLIPTEEDDSSLPAAFFSFSITNTSDQPLWYTLAGTLGNPFGQKGGEENRYVEEDGIRSLRMSSVNLKKGAPEWGELILATDFPEGDCQEYWYRGSWFDSPAMYWNNLSGDIRLKPRHYDPDDRSHGDHGTLTARLEIAPGETRSVRFLIGWYLPIYEKYWEDFNNEAKHDPPVTWKNYYAVLFGSAEEVAKYGLKNWDRLEGQTRLYQEALFSSTLPEPILDAVSATVSVMKSPTVLRLEDGSLYGWEGVWKNQGSCFGSCSHVWAYTYAIPFLFPRLERSMRNNEYNYCMNSLGGLQFRLHLPLGDGQWDFRPCADGQFATVFKVWREYCLSGDLAWLKGKWEGVKAALAYAWNTDNPDRWDPEKSGVLTGRQHHTLDMELFGPNSWLTSMYLCALRAGEEMARVLGDREAEKEYREIFERGSRTASETLFNGEYFCQNLNLKDRSVLESFDDGKTLLGGGVTSAYWNEENEEIKYQIIGGCAVDQVLGQWHADMLGLGDILDREKVNSALKAIYRNNFISMRDHFNPCRLYCINDEKGTLICSYPEGCEKPAIAVPYAEETMHGFEYQAAAHMIARGMTEEGLDIVKGVRNRYDGTLRNPWNEIECGNNYARSMAAFSLLLAWSGLHIDMNAKKLSVQPVTEGDFSVLWSMETGFGTVTLGDGQAELKVLHGSLELWEIGLPFSAGSAELAGRKLSGTALEKGFRSDAPIRIAEGETLILKA